MEKAQEIEMLKEFSDANATSGFEEEFVKLFTSYAEKTANIETDGMLNVYASKLVLTWRFLRIKWQANYETSPVFI